MKGLTTVTIQLIEDNAQGGYTAISTTHEEIVAEGNTIGEAIQKWGKIYDMMEEVKANEPK